MGEVPDTNLVVQCPLLLVPILDLRFILTLHIQELRGPAPKQRLLLCCVCVSPAWAPCTGSLTGVPSFQLPAEGPWELGAGITVNVGSEESLIAGRDALCLTAYRACRFGAPSLSRLCSLT